MMKKIIGFIICTLLITSTGFSIAEIDENRNELNINSTTSNLEHPKPLNQVDDWPMFRHDPQHSGYSTSKAPITNETRWSHTIG